MAKRHRLDVLMVERGLAATRERARSLILAGRTLVDGYVITKAGSQVSTSAELDLSEPDHPYVGRGGIKLAQDESLSILEPPSVVSPTHYSSMVPHT